MLSERVLARWWHSVASMKAMHLLHLAMRTVWYWRTTMAIKTVSKVGVFFIVVLLIVALVLVATGAIQSE